MWLGRIGSEKFIQSIVQYRQLCFGKLRGFIVKIQEFRYSDGVKELSIILVSQHVVEVTCSPYQAKRATLETTIRDIDQCEITGIIDNYIAEVNRSKDDAALV